MTADQKESSRSLPTSKSSTFSLISYRKPVIPVLLNFSPICNSSGLLVCDRVLRPKICLWACLIPQSDSPTSNVCLLSLLRSAHTFEPPFVNSETITRVNSAKYLGAIIDTNMNSTFHVPTFVKNFLRLFQIRRPRYYEMKQSTI